MRCRDRSLDLERAGRAVVHCAGMAVRGSSRARLRPGGLGEALDRVSGSIVIEPTHDGIVEAVERLLDPNVWAEAVANVAPVSGEGKCERWTRAYEPRLRTRAQQGFVGGDGRIPADQLPGDTPGRSAAELQLSRHTAALPMADERLFPGVEPTQPERVEIVGLDLVHTPSRSSTSSRTWRKRPASASSRPDAMSTTSRAASPARARPRARRARAGTVALRRSCRRPAPCARSRA